MQPISLVATAAGHAAPVTAVAISPHGSLLATASYDGTVIVWSGLADRRIEPGATIRHRRLANGVAWSCEHPGLLATASADKTVGLFWITDDGLRAEQAGCLARHTDDVNAVAWLSDGERLVTASEDSSALLWEWRTGRLLGRIAAHEGHCMAAAATPDGRVVTVGEDGAVFVVDLGRPSAASRRSFGVSIEGCAVSPNGDRIALACDDGLVRLVSPELDLLDTISGATSACRAVAFCDDGSGRLVVGSYDGSVRVVGADTDDLLAEGGRMWPRSLDTAGELVVIGSFGSRPVVLALDGRAVFEAGGPDTHGPNAIATDGAVLAVGLDSGLVATLPLAALAAGSTTSATAVRIATDPVLSLAAVPAGLVAGTYSGLVRRFAARGTPPALTGEVYLGAPVPSLAANPDGSSVLAGTYNGAVAELDLEGGLCVTDSRVLHAGSVKSIAWRDSRTAITGATDYLVGSLDREGGFRPLWYHGNLVNAVATDARGLVASASRDRVIQVARVTGPSARPVHLLGADESMKAVCILGEGDDAWILGGSYDFAVYSWHFDLASSPPDARLGAPVFVADQAIAAMLAVDPVTAVVAGWDGTIRLCSLVDGALVVGPAVRTDDLVARAIDTGAFTECEVVHHGP